MKKKSVLLTFLVVLVVALGGFGFYATHAVSGAVPGHVYKYQGVNKVGTAYIAFSANSDRAVVTHSKQTALAADQDPTAFDRAYQKTSQQGRWTYKASGSHLTLAMVKDNASSQWQYNWVTVFGSKIYAPSFTYQINNAGQGVSHKMTSFTRLDQ